jgi:hypothetical protein
MRYKWGDCADGAGIGNSGSGKFCAFGFGKDN